MQNALCVLFAHLLPAKTTLTVLYLLFLQLRASRLLLALLASRRLVAAVALLAASSRVIQAEGDFFCDLLRLFDLKLVLPAVLLVLRKSTIVQLRKPLILHAFVFVIGFVMAVMLQFT